MPKLKNLISLLLTLTLLSFSLQAQESSSSYQSKMIDIGEI